MKVHYRGYLITEPRRGRGVGIWYGNDLIDTAATTPDAKDLIDEWMNAQ